MPRWSHRQKNVTADENADRCLFVSRGKPYTCRRVKSRGPKKDSKDYLAILYQAWRHLGPSVRIDLCDEEQAGNTCWRHFYEFFKKLSEKFRDRFC